MGTGFLMYFRMITSITLVCMLVRSLSAGLQTEYNLVLYDFGSYYFLSNIVLYNARNEWTSIAHVGISFSMLVLLERDLLKMF